MLEKPRNTRPKAVVIAGPTASGKSSLGVRLCLDLQGEVVNADSMQVYRGMDIGTAKPSREEKQGIPHHLIDVVDPDEEFNAALFRSMALQVTRDISFRGKAPFLVGGTGLYIKALVRGLFPCSGRDTELRRALRHEWEEKGAAVLHRRLAGVDPVAAEKIHPGDALRTIRALEILVLTGALPSELRQRHGFGERSLEVLKFCLDVDRRELYRRIDARAVEMVEKGLVEETGALLDKGYSEELKPMKAIGYRHMVEYLKGKSSLDEAIARLQRDTRRYAKRQLTWFRGDPEYKWVSPGDYRWLEREVKGFLAPQS